GRQRRESGLQHSPVVGGRIGEAVHRVVQDEDGGGDRPRVPRLRRDGPTQGKRAKRREDERRGRPLVPGVRLLVHRRLVAYGSLTVWLQEAPHTSALSRRGSVVSRQLTLPLPLAFGSRYLKRQFRIWPLSGLSETVASKIAPLLLSRTLPGPHAGGAM